MGCRWNWTLWNTSDDDCKYRGIVQTLCSDHQRRLRPQPHPQARTRCKTSIHLLTPASSRQVQRTTRTTRPLARCPSVLPGAAPRSFSLGAPQNAASTAQRPRHNVQLLFLHACDLKDVALAACDAGVPHVVVATADLSERSGHEFVGTFYRALLSGDTVREAFDAAFDSCVATFTQNANASMQSKQACCPMVLLPANEPHDEALFDAVRSDSSISGGRSQEETGNDLGDENLAATIDESLPSDAHSALTHAMTLEDLVKPHYLRQLFPTHALPPTRREAAGKQFQAMRRVLASLPPKSEDVLGRESNIAALMTLLGRRQFVVVVDEPLQTHSLGKTAVMRETTRFASLRRGNCNASFEQVVYFDARSLCQKLHPSAYASLLKSSGEEAEVFFLHSLAIAIGSALENGRDAQVAFGDPSASKSSGKGETSSSAAWHERQRALAMVRAALPRDEAQMTLANAIRVVSLLLAAATTRSRCLIAIDHVSFGNTHSVSAHQSLDSASLHVSEATLNALLDANHNAHWLWAPSKVGSNGSVARVDSRPAVRARLPSERREPRSITALPQGAIEEDVRTHVACFGLSIRWQLVSQTRFATCYLGTARWHRWQCSVPRTCRPSYGGRSWHDATGEQLQRGSGRHHQGC